MTEKHTFTVPEYYPEFHCKMGACRHACCEGWPVSVSMTDYFRMLGEECSPELRRRIDTSLHLHKYPTPDEYAFIAPRWDGGCPLRHEDGRCRLQCEMGEDALSYTCRLYPRGVRTQGRYECSCAGSCEAVIELFLKHSEPLRFIETELELDLPKSSGPTIFDDNHAMETEVRMFIIRVLQNRAVSLPLRIMTVGDCMSRINTLALSHDFDSIRSIIETGPDMCSAGEAHVTEEHMAYALSIAEKMVDYAQKHSSSVHDYGLSALEYFNSGSSAAEQYMTAAHKMKKLLPDWETVFEHMLVNHLFFERYPFHSGVQDPRALFAGLCGIYGLIRFLSLGWIGIHPEISAFVDVCSAAFRLIDHTGFEVYAAELLEDCGCYTDDKLFDFIRL